MTHEDFFEHLEKNMFFYYTDLFEFKSLFGFLSHTEKEVFIAKYYLTKGFYTRRSYIFDFIHRNEKGSE